MEILNLQMGVGETKQFRKAGSYIEILSSSGSVDISLQSNLGGQTDNISGGMSGLFLQSDFGAFSVTNQYPAAQAVQLLICDPGELGGSRRQPGIVQVVDTRKATTLIGSAFIGNGSNVATAAQYGTINLYNPAASTVRAVIESITINNGMAAANVYGIGFTNVPLSGNGTGGWANKLGGGGLPTSVINQLNTSAADPIANLLPGQSVLAGGTLSASGQVVITPQRPFIVPPGYGLVVMDRTANSAISVLFDIYEESV